MAGQDFQQGSTSMIREGTIRDGVFREGIAQTSDASKPSAHPAAAVSDARVPAGRRISFVAWGAAGVAGVAMWVVILKLI
jgi:hypothetical protein